MLKVIKMSDLKKFRTRWLRWLGQKCRKDKPYWVTLLNTNWTSWADHVYMKNDIDSFVECQSRDYVKEYFSEAIEIADMHDLHKLDSLYCLERMAR